MAQKKAKRKKTSALRKLKRLLIWGSLFTLATALLLIMGLGSLISSSARKGFESAGPKSAKVETRMAGARLSFLTGKGSLSGIFIGNPEGYQTPSAFQVDEVSISIKPSSVAADKLVIRSIRIIAPEITIEASTEGSNLTKILENIAEATKGERDEQREKKPRKLQVDEFLLENPKINFSIRGFNGLATPLPIPTVRLENLGADPDGITGGELAQMALKSILDQFEKMGRDGLGGSAKSGIDRVTEKIKGIKLPGK